MFSWIFVTVFFSDLNLVIHVYRLYSYLWSFWLQDLSSMRLCIWNAFQNGQLNYHKVTYIWPWKFMNLLWILIIFLTWIFKPTNFPDTEIKVMYTLQRRKKDMPLPFSSLNPHPHPFKSVLWCPYQNIQQVLGSSYAFKCTVLRLYMYVNIQSNFKDLWANISTLLAPMQDTSTFQILLFKQHKQLLYVYVNEEIIYAYKYSLVYDWQPSMQFDLWPQTYTYSSALVSWYLMNSLEKNKSNM